MENNSFNAEPDRLKKSETYEQNVVLNEAALNSVNGSYEGSLGTSKPAFVWGILGLVMSCSFYLSVLGIIFSAIGLEKAKKCRSFSGVLYGRAKAGKICATIGLIVGIIATVIMAIMIVMVLVRLGEVQV